MNLVLASERSDCLVDLDEERNICYPPKHKKVLSYIADGGTIGPAIPRVISAAQKKEMLIKPRQDRRFQQENKRLAQLQVDGGDLEEQDSVDYANAQIAIAKAEIDRIKAL